HSFQNARTHAVTIQKRVTICGSEDKISCTQRWGKYLLIFIDNDGDKLVDNKELLAIQHLNQSKVTIFTKVSAGLPYININPDGSARQLGSFIVCPQHPRDSAIRRITWNKTGRAYLARELDGDLV